MAPHFVNCGDLLIVVRKGCALIVRMKLIVFYFKYELLWYFVSDGGFSDFLKSVRKTKSTIVDLN